MWCSYHNECKHHWCAFYDEITIITGKVPVLVIHNYFEPELISNNNNPRVQIMVCNFVELDVHEIDAKLLHTSTINMLVFSNSMWIEPHFMYRALFMY